jgi:hypothetical protein
MYETINFESKVKNSNTYYLRKPLLPLFIIRSQSVLKKNLDNTLTFYIGNIVYNDGKLSYILTDEGRMIAIGNGSSRNFIYDYALKDHLGNDRVCFTNASLGSSIDVTQSTSY